MDIVAAVKALLVFLRLEGVESLTDGNASVWACGILSAVQTGDRNTLLAVAWRVRGECERIEALEDAEDAGEFLPSWEVACEASDAWGAADGVAGWLRQGGFMPAPGSVE